jgi:hypothetical protein
MTIIISASMNWSEHTLLLTFEGRDPAKQEVTEYISRNYPSFKIGKMEINSESYYKGLKNPGTVVIYTPEED